MRQQIRQLAVVLLTPLDPGAHLDDDGRQGRGRGRAHRLPDGPNVKLLQHRPRGYREHASNDRDQYHRPSTTERRQRPQFNR